MSTETEKEHKEHKEDVEEYVIDEDKFIRNGPLKQDSELFDEELNIRHKVISVKRIEFKDAEDWEIKSDDKTVLVLKGVRFSLKEKQFFRTVDGVKFIINGFKNGWNSISEFKRNLK